MDKVYDDRASRLFGEPGCEVWESDDEIVVHNYHDDWEITRMLDEISWTRQLVQDAGIENNISSIIPKVLYWKWVAEYHSDGHDNYKTWEQFRNEKVCDRDYSKLMMMANAPLLAPNQGGSTWE